jgi:MFS family permease
MFLLRLRGSERANPRLLRPRLLSVAARDLISYVYRNVNGAIGPDIMRELGIGANPLGQLTLVYFLILPGIQLPVGVLLDRFGSRRVQSILLLCAAAGCGLCAFHVRFCGLLIGRGLTSAGTAASLMVGLKASAARFPPEQRPRVNGAFIMFGGLGVPTATWPVEPGLRIADRHGLSAVQAVAALMVALVMNIIVPDQTQEAVVAALVVMTATMSQGKPPRPQVAIGLQRQRSRAVYHGHSAE